MMRHCDGTDVNLRSEPTPNAGPCACGLRFDDVARTTVYPHVFIPTPAEKQAMLAALDTVALEPAA